MVLGRVVVADRRLRTRFAVELGVRGWWYRRFVIEYREVSRRVLGEEVSLSEKQFKNWVLEVMFPPWSVTELLAAPTDEPAPGSGIGRRLVTAQGGETGRSGPRVPGGAGSHAGVAVPLPPTASGEYLDEDYLESVRAHITRIVELDNEFGGTDLVALSARFFHRLHNKLGSGSYDPRLKSDLHAAAGELAEVVGWLAYDADQHDLARRMNHESLFFTRLAGDKSMELLTLQNASMHAATLGRPQEALHIAESVLGGPCRLSPRLQALFLARKARALAQIGDESSLRIFPEVRSLFLEGVNDGDPDWAWWIDERELAWHEGMAHRDLGHAAQAATDFERSVLATQAHRTRSLYLHRAYLLQSQMELGAWRDAEVSLDQIQALAVDVASTRTDVLLRGLLAKVYRPGSRWGQPPPFLEGQIARLRSTLGRGAYDEQPPDA
jgi:hypothetical protein